MLVVFGVNEDGFREILGAAEGAKEDKAGLGSFIANLKERGLQGVRLFFSQLVARLLIKNLHFYRAKGWI